jgi:hypothetical protein
MWLAFLVCVESWTWLASPRKGTLLHKLCFLYSSLSLFC